MVGHGDTAIRGLTKVPTCGQPPTARLPNGDGLPSGAQEQQEQESDSTLHLQALEALEDDSRFLTSSCGCPVSLTQRRKARNPFSRSTSMY